MQMDVLCVDVHMKTASEIAAYLKTFPLNSRELTIDIDIRLLEAVDVRQMVEMLENRNFNIKAVILLNNGPENGSGIECFSLIQSMKSRMNYVDIPFIIISDLTASEYVIKSIESGATAYITRPLDGPSLSEKLSEAIEATIPAGQRGKSNWNKGNRPVEDIITFTFAEMLNREVKAAARGNYPLTVSLFTFKENATADPEDFIDVLNRIIKVQLREFDSCFRYGNRGIIVLLPFADDAGADVVCNKIIGIFNTNSIIRQKNSGLELTAASVSYPKDGKVSDKLLDRLSSVVSK